MTDKELDDLETLTAAATPGPWELYSSNPMWIHVESDGNDVAECRTHLNYQFPDQQNEINAQFIARSREAIPALISALREARAELDFIKSEYGSDDEDQLTRDALLLKLRLQTSELDNERVSRREGERLYGDVVLALTAAGADMYHPEDAQPFPVLAIERLVSERNTAQAELNAMKARPVEVEFGRLDVMWQQLVRERDAAIAKSKEAFGDAFEAINSQLRYSSDAYIARITSEAFKRGVAAMREAAADACRPEYPDAVRRLRALPDPKDKEA